MTKKTFVLGLSSLLVLAASAEAWADGFAEPRPPQGWDVYNAPSLILASYESHFAALPLAAALTGDQIPWSDSYWPNVRGSIAYRWNSPGTRAFNFRSPGLESARSLSQAQLAALSPAEKYDLFMGHYDYPLTARVHANIGRSASWEGICHGWTASSLLYVEPAAVERVNPDGIHVPFGSSDVKALLSYYYAWDANTAAHDLGLRCDSNRSNTGACGEDSNAGAFHIILANQIALKHEGFIADIDRGAQVWNQPVYGYQSNVISEMGPGRYSAQGTARQVLVDTTMQYSRETPSQWEPVTGTAAFGHDVANYRYWLELNADGEIIGGQWISYKRPDFIWTKEKAAEFTGDLAGLTAIYKPFR